MSHFSDSGRRLQPLAIVGASARSAAASAVRAGFQPITADLFADTDLRRCATATRIRPYPNGLLDWLRAMEPPAWMYTGALENHPELVDQMAWVSPLWGNPGDVLARVRSPWELARALRAAGHRFPETRASCEGLPRDGSWLVKTYQGASGSGVRVWSDEQGPGGKEQGAADRELGGACFQRRIEGVPLAAVFVASGGRTTLLGVTRQLVGESWLSAHGFQYAGSLGPWPIEQLVLTAIAEIGNVLAAQFDLVGLFGVDMILDGKSVWTLEVNPRYTASVEVVERATGIHAIAAHAAACGEGATDNTASPLPLDTDRNFHSKAILFARRDVMISDRFAEMTLAEALGTPWPTLADISPASTLIEQGRPVLSLFAEGTDVEDVRSHLRERVAELERELYVQT